LRKQCSTSPVLCRPDDTTVAMKIDRSKLKKSASEVPADCKALIDKLKACSRDEFLAELRTIETWTYGKCELYHWIDILDICDEILEAATKREDQSWVLACDQPGSQARHLKDLVLWTLHFTTLLIEHSFSRHLYSSMEHLSLLLSSFDLDVVLAVLNLLYMFSKRSNFISRLAPDRRQLLLTRLSHLAASWGGKDNGFGLSKCCSDDPIETFPSSATTLHFEFYAESGGDGKKNQSTSVTVIHLDHVDKMEKTPAAIMEELLKQYSVPDDKQMLLFTYVRLADGFSDYSRRLKSVQARLQALSVLIYSNQLTDSIQSLLYSGLLEELVDVLEMRGDHLMEIKAAALKSLTSIIHLDRNPNFPKLNTIIDVTGAASYHGFLPVMVRNCIASLTGGGSNNRESGGGSTDPTPFPQPLATALFSFLYHLASYEAGGEALVSCGMMESLLKVIQWPSSELEHITFVTRAVRVIDLITNLDMASFQTNSGISTFILRLQQEVDHCRKHQPFEIQVGGSKDRLAAAMEQAETVEAAAQLEAEHHQQQQQLAATATDMEVEEGPASPPQDMSPAKSGATCLPQRAALLKSMLNFLKKAIQDPAFSDSIRHVMDGSLPASLKHIISNAEYYGPSLFLLATDVVTAYVFQEPSLLSSLQDKGLTDVVLHALLVKDVPATREVLGSLPNVFSALCLNTRGLEAFVACKPFERLFKVLLSSDYLPAMRRRRSADPLGDTASNLGNAMDELMRHQPSLKQAATAAIIKLLEQVCALGRDPMMCCHQYRSFCRSLA
jgi:E3 ubiquitin-protein ligase HUWE1